MVPALVFLAVEFHRAPLRYGHLTDPEQALPEAFGAWLTESCHALSPSRIQETADALGMQPRELREAFLFFLRHTLMPPRADHYRVLGLPRNCTAETVKLQYSLLVRLFHPDRTLSVDERGSALTARINSAYGVLRNPTTRRRYDLDLQPLHGENRTQESGGDFFRPRGPGKALRRVRGSAKTIPIRARPMVLWLLAGGAIAALLFFALRDPKPPALRINAGSADRPAAGPSFLTNDGGEGTHILPEGRNIAGRDRGDDPTPPKAEPWRPTD
jgi:hypothetical protein